MATRRSSVWKSSLTEVPSDATADEKEQLPQEQANAAVALLKMQPEADIWGLLRHQPDPRVRSYLIHRLQPIECFSSRYC